MKMNIEARLAGYIERHFSLERAQMLPLMEEAGVMLPAGLARGGRLAELSGVVELDFAAGAMLRRIDHARIDGLRIDVTADGTGVEFTGIEDAVDGLSGIHAAGFQGSHLDRVSRFQFALAGAEVLKDRAVVLNEQSSQGHRHPAVLSLMIVDGTELPDFPTDGDKFVRGGSVH